MKGSTYPEALVDTDWLAKHLGDSQLAVVEVDEDTSAYDTGHIPDAVALDWEHELHAPSQRDFVSTEQLAELLGNEGISSDQTLILYGGNNNWFAAYAYWLCKLRGVEDVKLLDGGRTKWELEQRPLTTAANRDRRDVHDGGRAARAAGVSGRGHRPRPRRRPDAG